MRKLIFLACLLCAAPAQAGIVDWVLEPFTDPLKPYACDPGFEPNQAGVCVVKREVMMRLNACARDPVFCDGLNLPSPPSVRSSPSVITVPPPQPNQPVIILDSLPPPTLAPTITPSVAPKIVDPPTPPADPPKKVARKGKPAPDPDRVKPLW